MELSKEQKQLVNEAVARELYQDCEIDSSTSTEGEVLVGGGYKFSIFNTDSGDINTAVEFYKIDVVFVIIDRLWESRSWEKHFSVKTKDRDESMRMAVVQATGVKL